MAKRLFSIALDRNGFCAPVYKAKTNVSRNLKKKKELRWKEQGEAEQQLVTCGFFCISHVKGFLFLGWIHPSLQFLPFNLGSITWFQMMSLAQSRFQDVGTHHPSRMSAAQTHNPEAAFIPTSVWLDDLVF